MASQKKTKCQQKCQNHLVIDCYWVSRRLKSCKTKELFDFICSKVYLYEVIEHILQKNVQNEQYSVAIMM